MKMRGEKSTTHVDELVDGCTVLATALDVGADFIEGQKIACIGELVAMAAAFRRRPGCGRGDVRSLGGGAAADRGGRREVEFAEQQIERYIAGQVVGAALKPLISKVESLVQGLIIQAGGSATVAASYEVDMSQLEAQGEVMRSHAQTVAGHVETFTSNVRSLEFTS